MGYGFLLKETHNNLKQNFFLSLSSMLFIAVILFICGMYLVGIVYLSRTMHTIKGELNIRIFFSAQATDKQIASVRKRLEKQAYFDHIHFVGKAEALAEFRQRNPHLAMSDEEIQQNPLPASLDVSLDKDAPDLQNVQKLLAKLEKKAFVDEIIYSREWVEKFANMVKLLRTLFWVIGLVLLVVATLIFFLIFTLSIFFRRREIDIMKLVGAPFAIIRTPFILEGVCIGVSGSILACTFLHLVVRLVNFHLNVFSGMFETTHLVVHAWVYILLFLAGSLAGGFGSYLSIEYHLVKEKTA